MFGELAPACLILNYHGNIQGLVDQMCDLGVIKMLHASRMIASWRMLCLRVVLMTAKCCEVRDKMHPERGMYSDFNVKMVYKINLLPRLCGLPSNKSIFISRTNDNEWGKDRCQCDLIINARRAMFSSTLLSPLFQIETHVQLKQPFLHARIKSITLKKSRKEFAKAFLNSAILNHSNKCVRVLSRSVRGAKLLIFVCSESKNASKMQRFRPEFSLMIRHTYIFSKKEYQSTLKKQWLIAKYFSLKYLLW